MMTYEKSFLYWLGLMAALMCVTPKLVPVGIAGMLVFVVIGYAKKRLIFQLNWPAMAFALLYIAYVIGTFFTLDRPLANHYIESKLSFLVFPLLLSFRFREQIDFRPVVIGLALGIVATSIIGFANAYTIYKAGGALFPSFTTSNFSNIHHPSYFCIFILTSAALLWHGYRQQWLGFRLSWILPLLGYYLLIYGLCLSLAGMLLLFGIGCVIVLRFIRKRFGWKGFSAAVIVFPALAVLLFLAVPQMKQQFGDASRFFLEYTKSPKEFIKARPDYKEGNEIRLIMWTVSAQEFALHPMGVGTGNVDIHLSARLLSCGQFEMGKKDANGHIEYNPHNQYLQTAMEIGVIGLLLLLILIVSALKLAVKYRNTALLILVSALAFNSLFESMFQRQSGIVFCSFWICLLIVWSTTQFHQKTQPDAGT